jgi:acetoacetate decarboxylase
MLIKSMVLACLAMSVIAFSDTDSRCEETTGYSMPLAAPEYGNPPRRFHDSKLATITFRTSPEALRKLVPKPMVPNPENLVSVYFGRFNTPDYSSGEFQFKGDSYVELGFVVPVTLGKNAGGYSLFLYLDKVAPLVSGREIWGYPKKEADITLTDDNGNMTVVMKRLGTTLMKATFKRTKKVEPLPKVPPRVRYNLKYIPSVKRNAPPDVMQITSNVQDNQLKALYAGKGTLELASTSVDPLGSLPILEIVKADSVVVDGVIDFGDVAYDYLKQVQK